MSSFPVTRLRRFRRTSGLRGLVRETRLSLDDFVMPLFVGPEPFANDELPGLGRHSVDSVVGEADELAGLGVKALILFGIPEEKDEEGAGAYDEDGIVQRAIRLWRSQRRRNTGIRVKITKGKVTNASRMCEINIAK